MVLAHATGPRACLAQLKPQLKVQWPIDILQDIFKKATLQLSVLRDMYMLASMQPHTSSALVNFIIAKPSLCMCLHMHEGACMRALTTCKRMHP